MEHLRKIRHSRILRQLEVDGTERDPRDVALEQYNKIVETHIPEQLPDDVLHELDVILKKAEQEAYNLSAWSQDAIGNILHMDSVRFAER